MVDSCVVWRKAISNFILRISLLVRLSSSVSTNFLFGTVTNDFSKVLIRVLLNPIFSTLPSTSPYIKEIIEMLLNKNPNNRPNTDQLMQN